MHIQNKVVEEFMCIDYLILFIHIQYNVDILLQENFKNGNLYKQLKHVLKF
jgi:hypothetical protein